MADYIERDAAMLTPVLPKENRHYQTSNLDDVYAQGWADALDNLKNAPAADVAQVVRCKDCTYSYEDIGGRTCSHGVCVDCIVPDNFCCAYGKREENNNEAGD